MYPILGNVWPGPCVFPDYTQSKVRAWWANLVKDFISNGVDGIWNDMNEPSVFKVISTSLGFSMKQNMIQIFLFVTLELVHFNILLISFSGCNENNA